MLAAALRRHVGDRALEHLEQRLLHPLARDVAGDRDVLARLADLVDLVDVEHPPLRGVDVEVGRVEQFEEQVLDVLSHVAGLGERGRVTNRERHVEDAGERAGQQRLPAPGRAEQQDVRLVDLDVRPLVAEHQPLVVAVDRDGEHPLGVLLPDHVLVEVGHDLPGGRDRGEELLAGAPPPLLLIEDRLAQLDAFAADVDVAGPLDERPHVAVALAAERAEGVLLGRAAGAAPPEIVDVFP